MIKLIRRSAKAGNKMIYSDKQNSKTLTSIKKIKKRSNS